MTDQSAWDRDQDRIAANLDMASRLPARSGAAQRRRAQQLGFDLVGGDATTVERPPGEFGDGDPLPPGPYAPGLTHWQGADGAWHDSIPYTVCCADGRAVAGHVPSRDIAEAIAVALNARFPAP